MRYRVFFIMILLLFPATLLVQGQANIDCESVLEIWQIQGTGVLANCENTRITTTENIVTALSPEGFFMQTPAERSDNDDLTSDGIYVYTGFPPIAWDIMPGSLVMVEGRVREEFDMSRIEATGRRRITIIETGVALPAAIDLGSVDNPEMVIDGVPVLERYEGMRVFINDAPVIAPTNYFDEFGISLSGSRAFREAGIESDVTPQFAGQNLPEWDLNYEIIEVDPEELGNDTVFATPGSTATVTGALGYAYRDYQIWAETVELNVTDFAVRPVRAAEADEFTIATQNIENFFDLVDDPDRDDATFEDYVPATEEVYALRLQKVSAQIREVLNAPDIVALQEIENENTLNDLISQIQSDDPAIVYEGCIFEGNDGRGIDNGYLVRQGRVEILDCYRMPGSLTEPGVFGGTLYGRPPLVLDAALIQDDMLLPITVINLHIKSLSGIEQNVTQQRRLAQAQGIAAYVQERLTENPDVQLIVAGDLNAFPFSDGLVNVAGVISGEYEVGDALVSPEAAPVGDPILINQVMRVPEADRYSYIFNSTSQVLDHILTTANLDALITDVQFSRGNADALYTFAESDASAMRSSDHDGFVIYLRFSE